MTRYLPLLSALLLAFSQLTAVQSGFGWQWAAHVGWFAWVPLFMVLKKLPDRQALILSFLTLLLYYALSLSWINIALVEYGHLPWPVSLVLFALLMIMSAVLMAPALVVGRRIASVSIFPEWITLPTVWVAFESIRLGSFTHFPWANISDTQPLANLWIVQWAEWTGQNGITWFMMSINVGLAEVLATRSSARAQTCRKAAIIILALALIHGVGGWIGNQQARGLSREQGASSPTLRLALLQGNIPQDEKWSPAHQHTIINVYHSLLDGLSPPSAYDLVIWPEAAFPLMIRRDSTVFPSIRSSYPFTQIIGAPSVWYDQDRPHLYNSIFLVRQDRSIAAVYDKSQLVPFGEYVPFKPVLAFVERLVPAIADFSRSPRRDPMAFVLHSQTLLIAPLICYEDIFSEITAEMHRKGAQILINVTNDAWYGRSFAAFQHLAISLYRVIETRLPLVRSTNTGITVVVNSHGQVMDYLDWFQRGVLRADIPLGGQRLTFHSLHPQWFEKSCFIFLLSGLGALLVQRLTFKYKSSGNRRAVDDE